MAGPRVIAVGVVVRHDGRVLVTQGQDPSTGVFHRLVGGAVEQGERGAEAVAREFLEEYGVVVHVEEQLAALENLFTYDRAPGHELVLVYRAQLADPAVAAVDSLPSREPSHPAASWVAPRHVQLVPPGLDSLLDAEVASAGRRTGSVGRMRKQYHFRPSERGLYAWDVDRLVLLTQDLPTEQVPVEAIGDADSDYWFSHGYAPTVRAVAQHARLINEADLSYPIIIDPQGGVMDGMHRVAKALLIGQPTISAKRLLSLPAPDYADVRPEDLPYDR